MLSTQEQLKRTQEELENLKAEYQEFAYIISHDLKAPFRAIGGFAKIISDKYNDSFDDKTKKYFGHITTGAQEGNNILDALMEFSRIGTAAKSFVQVDCNTVCSEVMEDLSSLIQTTNAQINISELPAVKADRQQLTHIFHHLLKNALTYHEKGNQPCIAITSKTKDHCLEFCIKDNGIGIKDNRIETIFKALRRAVANEEYPGAGMGLTLVKKMLQLHDGDIRVETEIGKGSAFYFTIATTLNNEY